MGVYSNHRKWKLAEINGVRCLTMMNGMMDGNRTASGANCSGGTSSVFRLIEDYQSERLKYGNLPATVNRHMATLAHMIHKAVDWEMVGEDTLMRVRKAKQLPENNRRLRFLSGEEARALVDACGKDHRGKPINDLHLQRIVTCALSTGMRKGEILSLEWDRHIDLDVKTGFATACTRAGLTDIRFHDLRHTFASLLVMTIQRKRG